jgi:hypothetical protein
MSLVARRLVADESLAPPVSVPHPRFVSGKVVPLWVSCLV